MHAATTDTPPPTRKKPGLETLSVDDLHVPMLPDVVAEVLAATNRPDSDARQLAQLAARDAALASHVVRLASSALFGAQRVSSLVQAVTRLGVSGLRQAAVVVAAEARLFRAPGHMDEVRRILKHSAAAACYAREISRQRRCNAEESFLAGLLHDVGKPMLLAFFAEPGARERYDFGGVELMAAVNAHHARVGGLVSSAWRLSKTVTDAVAKHHAPDSELAHTIALADAFSHWAIGAPGDKKLEEAVRAHGSLEALNLYPEDIDALCGRKDEVVASAGVLS